MFVKATPYPYTRSTLYLLREWTDDPERCRTPQKKPYPNQLAPRRKACDIAASLPIDAWQTITWREGSYGPLSKPFAFTRAYRANQKGTGPLGWLIHERPLPGEEGDCI